MVLTTRGLTHRRIASIDPEWSLTIEVFDDVAFERDGSPWGRGLDIAGPRLLRTRIELELVAAPSRAELLRSTVRCGDGLGGPPAKSSLQTFANKLVLYLPKQRLLDPKVAPGAQP